MKKMLCMLLALIMVLCVAGCGAKETPQETTKETQTAQTETKAPETEAEVADIAEITMIFWSLSGVIPKDVDVVAEAISEITREKIGVEVNLMILESGNYEQQINLMFAGGEPIDLMVTRPGGPLHFNSMLSQSQLTDITGLLEEYAPDLLSNLPERWSEGGLVDGKIYAVPSMGDKVTPLYFICRKDIVDQTGIDVSKITNLTELEPLLAAALEVAPELAPVGGGKNIIGVPYIINMDNEVVAYEALGDSDNSLISIMDGEGTTIKNTYEREEFIHEVELFSQWYEKGYIYKDAVTYAEGLRNLLATNLAFGYFGGVATGGQATESIGCGHEVVLIPMGNQPIATSKLRQFTWAVPSISAEPEAAVKFMNLMYSDADIVNLLCWGIEGTHYQTLADGTIDFIDGEDKDSCGYYVGDESSIIGNGYLAKVRTGQDVDLREQALELNKSTPVSEYVGFSFDSTGFENEIAEMTNIIAEYRPSLHCGFYTEELYGEFMQKMKDAGIDRYIAAVQEQFDAYLAAR